MRATGPKQVALTWTPSTPEPTSYSVYRNTVLIGTTEGDAANYLDRDPALVNGTNYNYVVRATDATGTSAVSQSAAGKPVAANPITGCGTLSGSGHYQLTADITVDASRTEPCLVVGSGDADSANFSLDCGGHTITQGHPQEALITHRVSGFLVTNCVFDQDTGTAGGGRIVTVDRGGYGRFSSDTFKSTVRNVETHGKTEMWIYQSPHAVVGQLGQENTFTQVPLKVENSSGTYVGRNTFTQAGLDAPTVGMWLLDSVDLAIVHNIIDGGWNGLWPAGVKTGSDDGILTDGVIDRAKISFNQISNTYDAGIEPCESVINSHIDDNVITKSGIAGFGHYHNTDLWRTTLNRNQISYSPTAFSFDNDRDVGKPMGAAGFRVSENVFDGNTFTNPTLNSGGNKNAAFHLHMPAIRPADANGPAIPGETLGNVMKNNSFAPTGVPLSTEIDVANPTTVFDAAQSVNNVCPPNAYFTCTPPVRGTVVSGVLQITTPKATANVSVTVSGSNYLVDNPGGVLAATGCSQTSEIRITCGSVSSVTITGSAGDDTLTANVPGAVTLNGGAGNDVLTSRGAGADVFNGGSGTDRVDYSSVTAGIRASFDGVANDGPASAPNDSVASDIEAVTGGSGDDVFTDGPGDKTFSGSTGNDTYAIKSSGTKVIVDGNLSSSQADKVDFSTFGSAITVTRTAASSQSVTATGLTVTMTGMNTVIGTAFNDAIAADDSGMTINGGAGNDTLTGGPGTDTITGGTGTDSVSAGGGNDTVFTYDSVAENVNCGSGNDSGLYDAIDTKTGCEA